MQVEVAELGVASDTLEAIADELVARQGAPWLPVDRQSRFGVTLAEEMSFTGVLLMSGGTSETDRVRAAVLADRSILAFDAMMAVSTTDQRERLQSVADAAQINALRRQAQLETMTLANNEVITALVQLADVTSVVNDVRSESAETIRATAADKAALASTKRDLALALVVAVVVAPLALLVTVGGRLSRRLEVLAEAARRVADGEMDMRIADTSGRDEVAEVSVAFNDVAETIARSHDQISALAEGRIDDPILDDELPGVIGQTLRLALRRLGNATAELAHQANHDKLTGLLDRRGLQAGLDSLVARDADGVPVDRGMILVDLDDFKQINDVHGHAAGDAVLREVAKRLVAGTRSGDLVARLGGDEFLVLTSSHSSCEATVDRLAEHIAMPIEWSGLMLPVTASIGWTSIGVDEHFEDVLHRADKAMYTAKRSGKNQSLSSER
ncbi:MAG: GGDEF domain-containing protein [Acidimicrobiales bacterium]